VLIWGQCTNYISSTQGSNEDCTISKCGPVQHETVFLGSQHHLIKRIF